MYYSGDSARSPSGVSRETWQPAAGSRRHGPSAHLWPPLPSQRPAMSRRSPSQASTPGPRPPAS